MKQRAKKMILAILIVTLAMPMNIFAANSSLITKLNETKEVTRKISEGLQGLKKEDDEHVRIIVEVEGKSIVELATAKGVHVNTLSDHYVEKQTEKLLDVQKAVIQDMETSIGVEQVYQQFTNVFNGFSTSVEYGDIQQIARNSKVKAVYIANEYERPKIIDSGKITQAPFVNQELGMTGEGLVVAIIDSGVDWTHRDFVIDDDVDVALTKDKVKSIVASENLKGKYYSEKVPYGYNYMDHNQEIRDLGVNADMHGMHVAGTVGANGNESEGGIKGVAPNVQILGLKVFGNDPDFKSTYSDVIIAAIDDAIVLGADVMNLSLGSTASMVHEDDPEQMAITNAANNGIVMSISAGNSAMFGYGYRNPYASNPDIGVVGAPGLTAESIQVASVYNAKELYETEVEATTGSSIVTTTGAAIQFSGYGKDKWDDTQTYELMAIGGSKLGDLDDYNGLDVKDKIVLVKRGSLSFFDKTENAAKKGAKGIIVYDSGLGYTMYKDQGSWVIPFMLISNDAGVKLEKMIDATTQGAINFTVDYDPVTGIFIDPNAGQISDFSSWGTTPSLEFKPDITAPGGNIYSTFNDDTYGYMSGTSMAAPHVSGGSALMIERIRKDKIFADYSQKSIDSVNLAKNILMNTAVPIVDAQKNSTGYTSPRVEGAGVMNLKRAMESDVVVTDTDTGLAKVNLGEISDGHLSFDLQVKNYGDKVAKYIPQASAQVNAVEGGINTLIPETLDSTEVFTVDGNVITELEVKPGETVVLSVDITVDSDELEGLLAEAYNGDFIEGYVVLYTDEGVLATASTKDAKAVTLSVPYISFFGDFADAPAFDVSVYREGEKDGEGHTLYPYYGVTGLVTTDGKKYSDLLGLIDPVNYIYDENKVIISPNGDGYLDDAIPIFSLLRNIEDIEFKVENMEGETLSILAAENELRKNYYDMGAANPYYLNSDYGWDGKINGKVADDGQYLYVIEGNLSNRENAKKRLEMLVNVDATGPKLTADLDGAILTATAVDEGSGLYAYVLLDASNLDILDYSYASTGVFDVSDLQEKNMAYYVAAIDNVGNETRSTPYYNGSDNTAPVVTLNIDPYGYFTTRTVVAEGTIDDIAPPTLIIDGKTVPVISTKDGLVFHHEVTYDTDGKKGMVVKAVDASGNEIEFTRYFYVDATAPVVETVNDDFFTDAKDIIYLPNTVDSYELEARISDNYPNLNVSVNGNMVYNRSVSFEENGKLLLPVRYSMDETVELEEGLNTFVIDVTDALGNVTTKTVKVYRYFLEDITDIVITNSELSVKEGEKFTLRYKVFSGDKEVTVNEENIKVTASNDNVLIDGLKVKGESVGTSTVTLSIGDISASIDVTVLESSGGGSSSSGPSTPSTPSTPTVEPETTVSEEIKAIREKFKPVSFIEGYDDGTFKPEGDISRAEISTILMRVLELQTTTDSDFDDVPSDYWASEAIATMEQAGLIKGYGNDLYKPGSSITKGEMATILSRIIDMLGIEVETVDVPYSDIQDHWAYDAIVKAYSYGIQAHEGELAFDPDEELTRAEAVVMVNQLMKRTPDTMDSEDVSFDDVFEGYWAYEHIKLAAGYLAE